MEYLLEMDSEILKSIQKHQMSCDAYDLSLHSIKRWHELRRATMAPLGCLGVFRANQRLNINQCPCRVGCQQNMTQSRFNTLRSGTDDLSAACPGDHEELQTSLLLILRKQKTIFYLFKAWIRYRLDFYLKETCTARGSSQLTVLRS